jgi:hypothetical protein
MVLRTGTENATVKSRSLLMIGAELQGYYSIFLVRRQLVFFTLRYGAEGGFQLPWPVRFVKRV